MIFLAFFLHESGGRNLTLQALPKGSGSGTQRGADD
jgi:hypothetical protein